MQVKVGGTLLTLMQGDITQQETEAIVNAANSSLMGGGGVDGAIHRAGGPQILAGCKEIVARQGKLPPGPGGDHRRGQSESAVCHSHGGTHLVRRRPGGRRGFKKRLPFEPFSGPGEGYFFPFLSFHQHRRLRLSN